MRRGLRYERRADFAAGGVCGRFCNRLVDIESYAPVSESEVRNLITRAEAVLNKEKRIKELEWKLANMVRWLDAHQPDVWKRGLWDAIETGEKPNG